MGVDWNQEYGRYLRIIPWLVIFKLHDANKIGAAARQAWSNTNFIRFSSFICKYITSIIAFGSCEVMT